MNQHVCECGTVVDVGNKTDMKITYTCSCGRVWICEPNGAYYLKHNPYKGDEDVK